MSEIKEKARKLILSERLPGDPSSEIADATPLINSGVLDSLGLLKLVEYLETEFKVKVEEAEITLENFGNLDRIEAFIGTKVKRHES